MTADTQTRPIFDGEPDETGEARLDAEAMADYRAGRVVPHAKVAAWLNAWGTAKRLPRPEPVAD